MVLRPLLVNLPTHMDFTYNMKRAYVLRTVYFKRVKKMQRLVGPWNHAKTLVKPTFLSMSRKTQRVKKTQRLRLPGNVENRWKNNVFCHSPLAVCVWRKTQDHARPTKTNGNYWKSLVFAGSTLPERRTVQDAVGAAIVAIAENYGFPKTVGNR